MLRWAVGEQVKQVRLLSQLASSPVCMVGTEIDYSPQFEHLLLKGKGVGQKQRRIFKLNPNHEILIKMYDHFKKKGEDKVLWKYVELQSVMHF
jgi:HSP90 family molecular chaperone